MRVGQKNVKLTTDQLITWFFTAVVAAGLFPADSETRARDDMAKIPRKERASVASGFKQGIRALLGGGLLWPKADVVDAALVEKGLPRLEEMRAQMDKSKERMLRRGPIKSDEEFYLAMELLDNLESGLTEAQRTKLGQRVYAYEEKAKTAKPR